MIATSSTKEEVIWNEVILIFFRLFIDSLRQPKENST